VAADVKAKTAELESLTQRIADVTAVVDKSNDQALAKTVHSVAQLPAVAPAPPGPPLEKVAQVHLSVVPTGKSSGNKTFYAVRFWVELPPDRQTEVAKVQYYFDNPTFVPKLWDSFDAKNGFQLKYTGWGCIDEVRVTLVARDGSLHNIPFKMCEAWVASGQKAVTPTW